MSVHRMPVIIDCDPGVDDAFAIAYAIGSGKADIQLLSVSAGNTYIDTTIANTLHLTELFKSPIPVVQGADKPLVVDSVYATWAQSTAGLCGHKYDPKKTKAKPVPGNVADVMFDVLKKNGEGQTTLMGIAPMTNIALLLSKYEDAPKYIKQIVFMGGSREIVFGVPYREFNIAFDPHAVEIVLKSGIPLVMVPMELGHLAYLDDDDVKKLSKISTVGEALAQMTIGYTDFHTAEYGAATHDSTAVAYIANPKVLKTEKANIKLEIVKADDREIAHIAIDFKSKEPNALICVDIDIDKFKQDLFKAIENLPN